MYLVVCDLNQYMVKTIYQSNIGGLVNNFNSCYKSPRTYISQNMKLLCLNCSLHFVSVYNSKNNNTFDGCSNENNAHVHSAICVI